MDFVKGLCIEYVSEEVVTSLLRSVCTAAAFGTLKKVGPHIAELISAHPYVAGLSAVIVLSVAGGYYLFYKKRQLDNQLADLKDNNENLMEIVAALLDNNDDLKNQLAALKGNNDDLKKDIAALRGIVAALLDDNDDLKVEIRCLRNDNGHLREELAAIREENADLKRENGEVKKELAAIRRENADLKEKMGEMHTSIDEMKKMMASMMMGRQETQNQNRDNAGNR